MGGDVAGMGEMRGYCRVLWGNLTERDKFEDHRRCEDNIRMEVMSWEGVDCIDLAQDTDRWWPLVNAVINRTVPHNEGNFLTS